MVLLFRVEMDAEEVAAKLTIVRCVDRLLDNLPRDPEVGIPEAAAIGLCECDDATALGVLSALSRNGFVVRDADGNYRLPTKISRYTSFPVEHEHS